MSSIFIELILWKMLYIYFALKFLIIQKMNTKMIIKYRILLMTKNESTLTINKYNPLKLNKDFHNKPINPLMKMNPITKNRIIPIHK